MRTLYLLLEPTTAIPLEECEVCSVSQLRDLSGNKPLTTEKRTQPFCSQDGLGHVISRAKLMVAGLGESHKLWELNGA